MTEKCGDCGKKLTKIKGKTRYYMVKVVQYHLNDCDRSKKVGPVSKVMCRKCALKFFRKGLANER